MNNYLFPIALVTITLISHVSYTQEKPYIWWEGENTLATNFPDETWFSSSTFRDKRGLLSEGEWLTNAGDREGEAAFAKYNVQIHDTGEYHFWTRKFWKHGPFRWRFDDQPWDICPRDIALADNVSIRKHLGANWVYLGEVSLDAGETIFELELLAEQGEALTACFDCFLLTRHPFVPRGKLKPDEKSGQADEGYFAWEPPIDTFSDESLLDLRHLNEEQAGMHGFIKKDGGQFVLGNGEPVRFWSVNASSGIAALDRNSIDYLARKLAKMGVNMVRYHSPLFQSTNPESVDPNKLDDLFYFIHALKEEGIYTSLSFYFPLWFDIQPHYGFEGFERINNKRPFTLLYFEDRMQEIYYAWAKQLLTTKNPYTGKILANEPAVAIVEMINEDSFFFWTFSKNNIPPNYWNELESRFSEWLLDKYGSTRETLLAWNNTTKEGDNRGQNHFALYEAWHMTGDAIRQANEGKRKRTGDQVEFLTELQRKFYEETTRYFKDELDSKSLVSAGNWHVTDPVLLDALERYTYTAGDVIDMHGYFSGPHQSEDGSHSYAVRTGHTFENLSALKVPERLPLQFYQVKDYPQTISEIGWTNPNIYRADFAFLASAYGALQGVDAIYTFALGGAFWDTGMEKFALSSPVILGNFPAYALLYRRGDVQEAKPVVSERLDLDELFAMKGSGGASAQAFDAFRQADIPPGQEIETGVKGFDPLSFYVGKVEREFTEDTHQSVQVNISEHINRDEKTISSITGELKWEYGDGIATINTPRCQAVTGYLNQSGTIDLNDVSIECGNEYAAIAVISLDNQPLSTSKKILIQAMTHERPYGFRASQGNEGAIENLGSYPFGVEKIQAKVTLKNMAGQTVTALDENGMPTAKTVPVTEKQNKDIEIRLNATTVYHIIQREGSSNVNGIF